MKTTIVFPNYCSIKGIHENEFAPFLFFFKWEPIQANEKKEVASFVSTCKSFFKQCYSNSYLFLRQTRN